MSDVVAYPWPANTQRLRLGELEFDLRFRSVHRGNRVHELNQRCYDLLLLFLSEPGVLHTREEIFRRVWGAEVVVEDANITTSIWLLRKALGEQAKTWIRTVSRQGYVFEPPGSLQPLGADGQPPAPVAEPAPELESAPPREIAAAEQAAPPPKANPRRHAARYWLAAAVLLLVAAASALLLSLSPGVTAPRRIVLVAPPGNIISEESRWPADLLQEWVRWQLMSLSDHVVIIAVTPSEGQRNDLLVLFGAYAPTDREGNWKIHVQFHGTDDDLNISRSTSSANLVQTVDQVAREVMHAIAPEGDIEEPMLNLDEAAAIELTKALGADRRRSWSEAAAHYRNVLHASPDFGFARLRLARMLAELGQSNAARAELAVAEPWLSRLPPAMQPAFHAQALGIREDYAGAAAAFGELWKNSVGERMDLRLAEAVNLRRAGRSRDALARLSGIQPEAPVLALPWIIERTEIELANRDMARARDSAEQAMDLARRLGWEYERGRATLLLADALSFSGQRVDDAIYAQAIDAFRKAGDELGVLRARVNQELRLPIDEAQEVPHLDALLAEARTAGNVMIETEALRRAGLRYFRHGDMQLAQERFGQALAVAQTAGDAYLARLVELHILRQDSLRGDLAALDRRLLGLRTEQLQGGMAFSVGLVTARLQFRRGQFDQALATLDATEDQLRAPESAGQPQIAVALGCLRATILLSQGHLADASTALRTCHSSDMPLYANYADIGEVELDLLTGNLVQARGHLDKVLASIQAEQIRPERWSLAVDAAPLLARAGELKAARALVLEMLAEIERSGQRASEADARATLAELDLAEGDSAAAAQQAIVIDRLTPADDWIGRRRLRAVQVLVARASGHQEEATRELAALHADARSHGDVLTELQTHSLAGAALDQLCGQARHASLLAQTGLRGASLAWISPQRQEPPAALVQHPASK